MLVTCFVVSVCLFVGVMNGLVLVYVGKLVGQ